MCHWQWSTKERLLQIEDRAETFGIQAEKGPRSTAMVPSVFVVL